MKSSIINMPAAMSVMTNATIKATNGPLKLLQAQSILMSPIAGEKLTKLDGILSAKVG